MAVWLCSFFYLFARSVSHFDLLASMNNAVLTEQKNAVDSIKGLETAKRLVKRELEQRQNIRTRASNEAMLNFPALLVLFFVQLYLWRKAKPSSN